MVKYLVFAAYNGRSFKGMVSNLSDRSGAIKRMAAALNITTECVYFYLYPLVKR